MGTGNCDTLNQWNGECPNGWVNEHNSIAFECANCPFILLLFKVPNESNWTAQRIATLQTLLNLSIPKTKDCCSCFVMKMVLMRWAR